MSWNPICHYESFVIQPFSISDIDQVLELQSLIWGQSSVIPPSLLCIQSTINGLTAVVKQNEKVVGGIISIPGFYQGKSILWSCRLMVHPDFRDYQLGSQLKQYQFEFAQNAGYEGVCWSFEPMQAKNAYINLQKLGCHITELTSDLYGLPSEESGRTDRFIVMKMFNKSEDHASYKYTSLNVETIPVVTHFDELSTIVRVSIPAFYDSMIRTDASHAYHLKETTLHLLNEYMGSGFEIIGFHRDLDVDLCYYVLTKL